MGQYYRPIVLKPNWKQERQPIVGALSPYDFDNGAKLMEHSYVDNNFVKAAMNMIDLLGGHKAVPFVWCGDYADPVWIQMGSIAFMREDEPAVRHALRNDCSCWTLSAIPMGSILIARCVDSSIPFQ